MFSKDRIPDHAELFFWEKDPCKMDLWKIPSTYTWAEVEYLLMGRSRILIDGFEVHLYLPLLVKIGCKII